MHCNLQVVNYSHLFPTRYALELESLKGSVQSETFKEPSQREDAKKLIKKQLEERYASGKNKWFFQALRVRTPFLLHDIDTYCFPRIYSSRFGLLSLGLLRMPHQNSPHVRILPRTDATSLGPHDLIPPRGLHFLRHTSWLPSYSLGRCPPCTLSKSLCTYGS